MADNNGKKFEKNIQDSCDKQNVLFERYKDNGKFGFGENTMTRFTSENPCDGHMFFNGNLIYLELKTAKTSSMSFNQPPTEQIKGENKPSIKAHQVNSLLKRSLFDGVYAGLLVSFSDRQNKSGTVQGGTYFIEINKWLAWAIDCGKKSMNVNDARSIGIEIQSKKLKVNDRYDIVQFLTEITA